MEGGGAGDGEVAADAARWTVLVYLDGDNNLESDALDDFREMAAVGSSDELKIVVQLDRISSREGWDDDSAGDWDGIETHASNLLEWVERGGHPPDVLHRDSLGADWNRVLVEAGCRELLAEIRSVTF